MSRIDVNVDFISGCFKAGTFNDDFLFSCGYLSAKRKSAYSRSEDAFHVSRITFFSLPLACSIIASSRCAKAEFAVLVQDYYQRRGIGMYMLDYLVKTARERGINSLYACVHRGNLAMCRFLEKSGRVTKSFCSLEDDEFIFKLDL